MWETFWTEWCTGVLHSTQYTVLLVVKYYSTCIGVILYHRKSTYTCYTFCWIHKICTGNENLYWEILAWESDFKQFMSLLPSSFVSFIVAALTCISFIPESHLLRVRLIRSLLTFVNTFSLFLAFPFPWFLLPWYHFSLHLYLGLYALRPFVVRPPHLQHTSRETDITLIMARFSSKISWSFMQWWFHSHKALLNWRIRNTPVVHV